MKKRCFKCQKVKPADSFYRHPQTSDGRLGKCRVCTKYDVKERYKNPESRKRIDEYEKKRWNDPERRKKVAEYQRVRRKKFPGKDRVRSKVSNALRDGRLIRKPCKICGKKAQAHHSDYRRPFLIIWLCFFHHRKEHSLKKK